MAIAHLLVKDLSSSSQNPGHQPSPISPPFPIPASILRICIVSTYNHHYRHKIAY